MGLSRVVVAALLLFAACTPPNGPFRATTVPAMMDSTVRIEADIEVSNPLLFIIGGQPTINMGWVGSGVVVEKTSGLTQQPQSLILTANHVLDAPKKGTKLPSPIGPLTVESVSFKVFRHDGKACALRPLLLGSSDTEDVATALADCDAGLAVDIADQVPARGEWVSVSGYPLGVDGPIVTQGYVSDWAYGGYLLVSAGATHGNSGGPVFYRGEVVGLLVRGAEGYPNISLVVPLKAIHDRLADTRAFLARGGLKPPVRYAQ